MRKLKLLGLASFFFFQFFTISLFCQTELFVSKSGSDVVFNWNGGSPNYIVARSDYDPKFLNDPQILTSGISDYSYAYTGAVDNGITLQFFDVAGSDEESKGYNYTGGVVPPEPPEVTSFSPTSGLKVGDTLTINGSNFSTILSENVVHFSEGITAIPTSATQTQLEVTIPRGAMTGSFWVERGHQISNSNSLTILTQNGFKQLSGIAFQPNTKDVWISDRGTGSSSPTRIFQLSFSGTNWSKSPSDTASSGSLKFQGGQGFDSTENWYLGLSESEPKGTTFKKPTHPSGNAVTFTKIKSTSSDLIQVLGVATSPSFTDTAFFAYADVTLNPTEKHIKKLSGTDVLDTDYGNFGSTQLNFNSLCGLALDLNDNLYDTETTQVRKIEPSESSSIVATGFSGAMGIAVDQLNTGEAGSLLVTDSYDDKLYLVDLSLPSEKKLVASGLSLPRASCFGVIPLKDSTCTGLPNTDLSYVLIAENTQVRQIQDPRITIEPKEPVRVWISKLRSDDCYPSSYQSSDHQINIQAKTTKGRTVYFRVIDPPDSAPYSDGTTTGFYCDNKDTGANAGKLSTSVNGPWENVVSVEADNDGNASVILNTTDRYAGDNYIIQASFDDWISSQTKALAETGIITAWKRVYIEKDKMFKRGNLFDSDVSAPPDGQLYLRRWDDTTPETDPIYVQGGDQIVVFDTDKQYPDGNYETATILTDPLPDFYDAPLLGGGTKCVLRVYLNKTLSNTYVASPLTFDSGKCAAVGVPSQGFYIADISSIWDTFNDAFVEFWFPPDGRNAVPYVDKEIPFYNATAPEDTNNRLNFHSIWWKNGAPNRNFFHLLGCRGNDFIWTGSTTGITDTSSDYSFVYGETIVGLGENEGYSPYQIQLATQAVTLHEIAHQFLLNRCADLTCGESAHLGHHDSRPWWNFTTTGCPNANPCLMDWQGGNLVDGINRFCKEDLFLGDPTCTNPDSKLNSSIRTIADPIP